MLRKLSSSDSSLTFKYNSHRQSPPMLSLQRAAHAESVSLMFSFWISLIPFCQHSPSIPCPASHVRCISERRMFGSKLDFPLGSAAVLVCSKQCPVSWLRGIPHTRINLGKIWPAMDSIWIHLLKKLIPTAASLFSFNCSLHPCSLSPSCNQHSGHILYEMSTNCCLEAKEQLPKASSAQLPGACLDVSSSILHCWMLSASQLIQSAPCEGSDSSQFQGSFWKGFCGKQK